MLLTKPDVLSNAAIEITSMHKSALGVKFIFTVPGSVVNFDKILNCRVAKLVMSAVNKIKIPFRQITTKNNTKDTDLSCSRRIVGA